MHIVYKVTKLPTDARDSVWYSPTIKLGLAAEIEHHLIAFENDRPPIELINAIEDLPENMRII